ncbi:NADP-dependent phosphogluconate dehydrogenase [Pseudomonadota bacterium]
MADNKAQIGLVGLAVMGANFARNLANNNVRTVVYNRTTEVMEQFIVEHGNENLTGQADLEAFVKSIEAPRKIILLVKAGPAVEAVIESLTPLLEKGDTILDFGNSNYHDTQKRFDSLKEKGIHFFGCGISGGELGALSGPSLMPGGEEEVWKDIKPILESVAAKDFNGNPCVTLIGHGPAGHYVKMVHNGIEYGLMQIIAETYDILKTTFKFSPPDIAKIFKKLNDGKLNSFLYEITVQVLNKEDDLKDGYLIDAIKDKAGQKGTGNWTAVDSLERGVATPTITEAVYARILSSERKLKAKSSNPEDLTTLNKEKFFDSLENGLLAANILTYTQGFNLIKKASEDENWNIDLSEVSRIWQGGCIIRSSILSSFEKDLSSNPNSLLEGNLTSKIINESILSLKWSLVALSYVQEVPSPCLVSALNYYLSLAQERGSAVMIQALRDNFGAHEYERIDKEGSFHTEWNK